MRSFVRDFRREWDWESKWLAVILGLVILLRIPSLFEPYWYGDEGVYQTIGQALSRGWVLYQDIHDNKPPFIYYLSMVGSQPVVRAMILVWTLAGTIIFFKLCRLAPGPRLALLSALAFGVLMSVPFLEGNIANAENFFVVLTTAGMLGIYRVIFGKKRRMRTWALLAGVAFSLGTLFKVPAVFDAFAGGLLIASAAFFEKDKRLIKAAFFVILGFIIPWAVVGMFEWTQGAWSYFLKEAVFNNISYLSSWNQSAGPQSFSVSPGTLTGRVVLAILSSVFIIFLRKRVSKVTSFSLLWLVWAFVGATLSGRPYAHYFLQIVPPFILVVGGLFRKNFGLDKFLTVSGIGLSVVIILNWRLWSYRTIPYYENFLSWTTGGISKEKYYSYFDPATLSLYELASYLTTTTSPNERIFIWGDQPSVYSLAHRLPVGRYTTAYHVTDFDPGEKETTAAIDKFKPRVVVWMIGEKSPYPKLAERLSLFYTRQTVVGGGVVYLKIPAGDMK